MKGNRGGRAAVLPDVAWQPPQRVLADGEGMTVRFIEESGVRSQVFDFARLPGEPGVQRWLAGAFARRTGPRSGVKRLESACGIYGACRRLAAVLAAADPPPSSPAALTSAHIAAFSLRYAAMPTGRYDLITLRALLREDPDLPEPARAALLNGRLPAPRGDRDRAAAYSDQDWQLIMTAVRGDVRRARDRISAGRSLLARHRAGQLHGGSTQALLGELLEIFDRTGTVPRKPSGDPAAQVSEAGGVDTVASSLCLTADEMTAFGLLLAAQTGQNFGTIAAWPAIGYEPGGPVTLIEQVKPRRGPDREHMVTALEDLPPGLAGVLSAAGPEDRLFRSPLRAYRLLTDLTACSRRHLGTLAAFTAFSARGGGFIDGMRQDHVYVWARNHQFPTAAVPAEQAGGRPAISVRRIRQTVIETTRHPVAHTRATMNDHYLARSARVRTRSQTVVGDALRSEVAKARDIQAARVFTAAFIGRFRQDPAAAAAEAGMDEAGLRQLIDGDKDTAVTAWADHLSGPYTEPGQPCTASFLACLDCPNARALPRHLPLQLAMTDHLAALRPHLVPALWQARYGPRLGQLQQILGCYTAAERDQARAAITSQQRSFIADVVAGHWDLR